MQFHPSLVNYYICVFNDGHAVGLNKKGKPYKAVKVKNIKFWSSKHKVIKFASKHPQLGIYVITSIVSKQLVED